VTGLIKIVEIVLFDS